jgi:hypothetical protein
MSKTFPEKIDTLRNVVLPRFCFVLSRIWVFLGDESSKTQPKNTKNRRNLFTKNRRLTQNNFVLEFLFITFVGVFRRGEFETPYIYYPFTLVLFGL